jgi:type II secretory pathway pseudopilin PulG
MVAVVLAIMILTILIAAVGPSIGNIMKREREEELIFRGKQIARGIGLFQRRYGRYPTSLKEMYANKPRTVRKLWKDPMCNCEKWHLLIQGTPEAQPMFGGVGMFPPGMPQFGPQTTPLPGGGPPPPPSPPTTGGFFPTPTPGGIFGQPGGEQVMGPIAGVRSNVHKEALREWRGQKFYDQWRFIVGDADRDVGPPGPGVVPGPRQPTPFGK